MTLLMPTGDKLANLDPGVPRGRRVPPGLAALAAQFPGLLAGTPGAADFVEDLVRRAGHEDAYLVNLAVVLSRERRIHLGLPSDHPLRAARLPVINDAWSRARERLRAAAGRRLSGPAPPPCGGCPGARRCGPPRGSGPARAASRPPGG